MRAASLVLLIAAGLAGCEPQRPDKASGSGESTAADQPFALGVDVLLRDSLHLLDGRRVGLITNHTGVSWDAGFSEPPVSTIDRFHLHDAVDLVALFSPEHGIQGRAEAGEVVGDAVDDATRLPIRSLYGQTRKPTPDMLEGIDVLIFDIQDIGARYYTYVWTMALAMEAAGEAGIEFVVLDRPNPIGGDLVQGNVLDPDFATFVGLYPVPMRHGLTVGELARMLVGEFGVEVDLTVVPMEGWSRDDGWPSSLRFIPPSPNMPSVESALHYPGTCLFEGTNLSVGRGTDRAFQWIGAPWLDAEAVALRLNAFTDRFRLPGGADSLYLPLQGLEATSGTEFTPESPGDGKYDGVTVRAIEFPVTDPHRYDPVLTAVAALKVIHDLYPDRLEWNEAHFDRLAGTDELRLGIIAGRPLEEITAEWRAQQAEFRRLREPYLLY